MAATHVSDGGDCGQDHVRDNQGLGVGGERVDVVPDGVVGQLLRPGRGGELRAEEDVFPSPDELFVHLRGQLVEHQVPEHGVELRGEEQGR